MLDSITNTDQTNEFGSLNSIFQRSRFLFYLLFKRQICVFLADGKYCFLCRM